MHKHCSYAQELYGIRKNDFPRACMREHTPAVKELLRSRAGGVDETSPLVCSSQLWEVEQSQFTFFNTSFLVSRWGDLTTLSHTVVGSIK